MVKHREWLLSDTNFSNEYVRLIVDGRKKLLGIIRNLDNRGMKESGLMKGEITQSVIETITKITDLRLKCDIDEIILRKGNVDRLDIEVLMNRQKSTISNLLQSFSTKYIVELQKQHGIMCLVNAVSLVNQKIDGHILINANKQILIKVLEYEMKYVDKRKEEISKTGISNIIEQTDLKSVETEVFTFQPDYSIVTLRGVKYDLTKQQANVVKALHEEYLKGNPKLKEENPGLKEEYLLVHILDLGTSKTKLKDYFKKSNAWLRGHLIIRGKRGYVKINL